jgi:hypothetical protein
MLHSHPASGPEPNPTAAEVAATDRPGASEPSATPSASRLAAMAMIFGLAAGVVSWLIGESVVNMFRPPF